MSSNRGAREAWRWSVLAGLLLASGCVTGGSDGTRGQGEFRSQEATTDRFGAGGRGASKKNPYPACGPRDSYRFIAETFICPDGSNPFKGDLRTAASSRRGNVGSHLDHAPEDFASSHIVDVYAVPCPTGQIDVYVCMYHCPK